MQIISFNRENLSSTINLSSPTNIVDIVKTKLLMLKVLRKLKFLKTRTLPLTLMLNKKKFKVPIINQTGFNNHRMDEFWMLDIFKKLELKNDSRLFDIGANVGQTLLKWKATYPNNAYWGFEPLPECVKYLNTLIKENAFTCSTIVPKTVYDQRGIMDFYLHYNDNTDRSASLIKNSQSITDSIKSDCVRLDEFLKSKNIVLKESDILKIDVEGAEHKILLSSQDLITQTHPVIILEILSSSHTIEKLNNTFNLIKSYGYYIYRIEKDKNHFSGLEKIQTPQNNYSVSESDFLCLPINSKHIKKFFPNDRYPQ